MKCSDARVLERLPECLQVASVRVSNAFERRLAIFCRETQLVMVHSVPATNPGSHQSIALSFRFQAPHLPFFRPYLPSLPPLCDPCRQGIETEQSGLISSAGLCTVLGTLKQGLILG